MWRNKENTMGSRMRPDIPERIVCAAIKIKEGDIIIAGVRHFDNIMRNIIRSIDKVNYNSCEQGFLTNKYRFVNRYEAWDIAKNQDQLIWGKDREPGPLFSEDLY